MLRDVASDVKLRGRLSPIIEFELPEGPVPLLGRRGRQDRKAQPLSRGDELCVKTHQRQGAAQRQLQVGCVVGAERVRGGEPVERDEIDDRRVDLHRQGRKFAGDLGTALVREGMATAPTCLPDALSTA